MPKIEYPAYFERGIRGVKAKDDINHREMFFAAPFKMAVLPVFPGTCTTSREHRWMAVHNSG